MYIPQLLGLDLVPNGPIGKPRQEPAFYMQRNCNGNQLARCLVDGADPTRLGYRHHFRALFELNWVLKVPICRRLRLRAATVDDYLDVLAFD